MSPEEAIQVLFVGDPRAIEEAREQNPEAFAQARIALEGALARKPVRWEDLDLNDTAARHLNATRLSNELRLYVMYSRHAGQSFLDIEASLRDGARDEWERIGGSK